MGRAASLRLQRTGTFDRSTRPRCVATVRDVVGPHRSRPERALLQCVGENRQIRNAAARSA